ncbi:hypothetical protein DPMN_072742 [Dreissena polymorpha]|uniref:Uncharacterized protein n=1 Tax=Dreissena polymorpha TaxID=45954 RepID=A0A9D4HCS7_DREPO|nr:hypothetical protein DPMN_072742 [Dreissena polymorpha]
MYFVPELCTLISLSEEARANITIMKDVAVHTGVAPANRESTLTGFINQINTYPQVRQEMGDKGLKFSNSLVMLNARVMPQ